MRLSDLQLKEIINLNDGRKLGKIIDVEISNDKIVNLIVETKKSIINIFKKSEEVTINWNMITKIGEDVILINNNNENSNNLN